MFFRSLIVVLLLGVARAGAAPAVPSDFATLYDKLAALFDQAELSPLDVAAGSLHAARFYAVGRPGLATNRMWFKAAPTRGRASASGLFVVVHGQTEDLIGVRTELETNRTKRGWLYEMVGTEPRFRAALMNGKMWAPLSRVLPATEGCRTMAVLCLRSRDPLVRRAGAFWGYWFADAPYWSYVRRLAEADADGVNRQVGALLMQRAPRAPAAVRPSSPGPAPAAPPGAARGS